MDKYLNKIINADCLEVMKEMPDKSIDLVLTDPPYGIEAGGLLKAGYKHKSKTMATARKDYGASDWDRVTPPH